MASYTGSPASGKQGNIVYSRNRYGQYTRILRIPVNPQTAKQQTIRGRFATISAAWRNLTVNQRTSWGVYAEGNPVYSPKINGFIVLAGNAMHLKINQQRLQIGLAITGSPPTAPAFVTSTLTLTAAVTASVLTIGGTNQPAGYIANCFCTAGLSPGISFPTGFVKVATAAADTWGTAAIDIQPGWQTNFGTLVEGQRIWIDAQLVSDEGVYGARLRTSAVVAS